MERNSSENWPKNEDRHARALEEMSTLWKDARSALIIGQTVLLLYLQRYSNCSILFLSTCCFWQSARRSTVSRRRSVSQFCVTGLHLCRMHWKKRVLVDTSFEAFCVNFLRFCPRWFVEIYCLTCIRNSLYEESRFQLMLFHLSILYEINLHGIYYNDWWIIIIVKWCTN